MSSTSWTTVFKISEKEFLDLRSASAGDPLRAALVSGRVPEREYFAWAMKTHELPRVKSDFFQIPPDLVFYEAVKRDFEWSHSFVPLAEWNGVLLVGCLEPPQFHFRVPYETRFVLASPEELAKRFEILEPSKRSALVIPPMPAAPQPAEVKPVEKKVEIKTPPPVPRAPSVPPPPPVPQPPPQQQADAHVIVPPPPPVRVKLKVAPAPVAPAKDETLKKLLSKPDIELPTAPDISLDEPDGLVFDPERASDDRMAIPDGIREGSVEVPKPEPVKETTDDAPDGLSEKTFVTSNRIDFGTLSMPHAKVEVPPPPTAVTTAAPSPVPATGAKIEPFPPTVPKPPTQATDFNSIDTSARESSHVVGNNVAIIPFDQAKGYDDLAGAALGRVLKHFDVGMILLFQNGQLKPWKWTELMYSVKGDEPDAIELEQASIFRIVFRTCLPYHGYVSPSAVNTAFFNAFFRGLNPKHATIMPVLINKKVAGMILGLANHEVDLRKTLGEMEVLAADFASNLERVKSQQKKAA